MTYIEELDLLRKNIAKVNDLKPDVVLSDDLMEEIVRRKPKSLEELKQIPLISPTMIDLLGIRLLKSFHNTGSKLCEIAMLSHGR